MRVPAPRRYWTVPGDDHGSVNSGRRQPRVVRPAGQRTGHIMSSATYRTLLRLPGAAAFFLTAAVGRVGIAMTGLGIVWLVHARTGSYATAGLVTGGFAVAEAVAGPQLARLIDRFGQTRVLPPALLAHAAAVATLLALVAAGTPDWLMMAGGVLAAPPSPSSARCPRPAGRRCWATSQPRRCRPRRAGVAGQRTGLPGRSGSGQHPRGDRAPGAGHDAGGSPGGGRRTVLRRAAPHRAAAGVRRCRAPPGGPLAAAARIRGPGRREPGHRRVLRRHADLSDRLCGRAWRAGRGHRAVPGIQLRQPAGRLAVRIAPVAHGSRMQLAVAATWLAIGCLPLLVAGSPFALGFRIALTGLAIPPLLVLCSVLAELAVDRAVADPGVCLAELGQRGWLGRRGGGGWLGGGRLRCARRLRGGRRGHRGHGGAGGDGNARTARAAAGVSAAGFSAAVQRSMVRAAFRTASAARSSAAECRRHCCQNSLTSMLPSGSRSDSPSPGVPAGQEPCPSPGRA